MDENMSREKHVDHMWFDFILSQGALSRHVLERVPVIYGQRRSKHQKCRGHNAPASAARYRTQHLGERCFLLLYVFSFTSLYWTFSYVHSAMLRAYSVYFLLYKGERGFSLARASAFSCIM